MSKPLLGLWVGALLGALDGLSAWFSPEARPMMLTIVIGSTAKGIVTGLLAGLIARWRHSGALGIAAGVAIGFVLSSLAAIGQGGHYFEIVLPGMLVGALVGFVTQRYPLLATATRSTSTMMGVVFAVALPAASTRVSAQSSTPADSLAPVARLVGQWAGTSEGQPGNGESGTAVRARPWFSIHSGSQSQHLPAAGQELAPGFPERSPDLPPPKPSGQRLPARHRVAATPILAGAASRISSLHGPLDRAHL